MDSCLLQSVTLGKRAPIAFLTFKVFLILDRVKLQLARLACGRQSLRSSSGPHQSGIGRPPQLAWMPRSACPVSGWQAAWLQPWVPSICTAGRGSGEMQSVSSQTTLPANSQTHGLSWASTGRWQAATTPGHTNLKARPQAAANGGAPWAPGTYTDQGSEEDSN